MECPALGTDASDGLLDTCDCEPSGLGDADKCLHDGVERSAESATTLPDAGPTSDAPVVGERRNAPTSGDTNSAATGNAEHAPR